MINKLEEYTMQKKENPLYIKLKKLNSRQKFADKIISAFYLGGLTYTTENHKKVLTAISLNRLDIFLKDAVYNSQEDNMELYHIEESATVSKIIIIIDYLELYHYEEVIEVIPYNVSLNIPLGEKIYP